MVVIQITAFFNDFKSFQRKKTLSEKFPSDEGIKARERERSIKTSKR
jgi:hypothetical protein